MPIERVATKCILATTNLAMISLIEGNKFIDSL